MERKNYTLSTVALKQLEELKQVLGVTASEAIRIAVRDLYKKEVKNAS